MPFSPQYSAVCLKGYRELLRKLRQERSVEEASPAVLQRAKERVFHSVYSRRRKDSVDLHRAFARLYDRLVEAKSELKLLKDEKKEKWLAKYAAVRGQLVAAEGAQAADAALLGHNGLFRAAVLAGVGGICKLFMAGLAHTRLTGGEILEAALKRPPGQALITISNHVAAMDDPLVLAAALPMRALGDPAALRWTMCATDRCFKHAALSTFFRAGKVLPVERGAGLAQPGIRAAEARLASGDWVHIFPEGTRSRDGLMGPMRKGVGRLVASCSQPPLVVPLVHSGMDKVMAPGAAVPRVGQQVDIMVGDPIAVEDLLDAARSRGWSDDQLYRAITQRVGLVLYSLKARLEGCSVAAVVRGGVPMLDPSSSLIPLIQDELDTAQRPWHTRAAPLRASAAPLEYSGSAIECSQLTKSMPTNLVWWQQCLQMLRGRKHSSGKKVASSDVGDGVGNTLAAVMQSASSYPVQRTQHMIQLAMA